jgi:5-dehydro-2-deoxygluconokinase
MPLPPDQRPLDFVALGRAAVDLYGEQVGGRLEDMSSFAKYLGGCPANISVGAARLGLRPAMLARVGDEHMGRFVRETLHAEGVDVSHVRTDPHRLTALVLLGIRDQSTFPLIFYRENCADMAVSSEDFDADFVASARALLVTGTHFSTQHVDRTSRHAIAFARAAGTKVVLDIDYRPVLWGLTGHGLGEERFIASDKVSEHLQRIAPLCDLIVGTEEEIHIAGGSTDTFVALRRLRAVTKATLVVKRGGHGCTIFTGDIPGTFSEAIDCPGFKVEVFNVLGAGDGFMAGLMRGWLRGEDWQTAATYANACGALVVSRHGCAPAMPSWAEMESLLARAGRLRRLDTDPEIIRLHRVTTGRKPWPLVTALAFDHRRQFEDLAAKHGKDASAIETFKSLIAEAALSVGDLPGAGAIVDDRFGRPALHRLGNGVRWIARPVELPGSLPLAFEAGDDLPALLRTWPAGHVAKVLVMYRADDAPDLCSTQEAKLRSLQSLCHASGHEWLLEVIPPGVSGIGTDKLVADAVRRLYEVGLEPDWWKLPPMATTSAWHDVADIVRRNDRHCRGIVILGLDSNEDDLASAFSAARNESLVKGFAVGRHIFWSTAEEWFAGRTDDRHAVTEIAVRYRRVIELWSSAQSSAHALAGSEAG